MTYSTPNDQQYIQNKVKTEVSCQFRMDCWYRDNGFKIVDRVGNRERDLVLIGKGRQFNVEEKYRERDYGDLLIEIIQDMVGNKPGWFYTEKPDILTYIILNSQKIPITVYWILFDKFKNWFYKFITSNSTKTVVSANGYGLTLNISIPWICIPEQVYSRHEIYEIYY